MARYYSDWYKCPSAVYRIYDVDDTLLYVGMSMWPENRLMKHRAKPWGREISRMDVEWYPDRESAKRAERYAIHHESPEFNLVRPHMECC